MADKKNSAQKEAEEKIKYFRAAAGIVAAILVITLFVKGCATGEKIKADIDDPTTGIWEMRCYRKQAFQGQPGVTKYTVRNGVMEMFVPAGEKGDFTMFVMNFYYRDRATGRDSYSHFVWNKAVDQVGRWKDGDEGSTGTFTLRRLSNGDFEGEHTIGTNAIPDGQPPGTQYDFDLVRVGTRDKK